MATPPQQKVKSVCGLCCAGHAIDVAVEGGRVVGVTPMEESPNKGQCVKGLAETILEWEYSPRRLTRPLIRRSGEWHPVSWEGALGFIAEKLQELKGMWGAEAVAVYLSNVAAGAGLMSMLYSRTFCNLLGTPNFSTVGSYCYYPRILGDVLTLGSFTSPDLAGGSRCLVLWGVNPSATNSPLAGRITRRVKEDGMRLIVVDPRRIPLARTADIHLQLRPGTDGALALGMMNIILSEDLYDKGFAEKWIPDLPLLKTHLEEYTPHRVEQITGVGVESMRQAVETYAEAKPSAIMRGVALDLIANGVQAQRTLALLMALTGNVDRAGGNVFVRLPLPIRKNPHPEKALGFKEFPLYVGMTGEAEAALLVDAILEGRPYPVMGLIVQGANPLLTWPFEGRVRRAFESLDLLVVVDVVMNETAELADVVLPAASFLEKTEICNTGGFYDYAPLLTLRNQATPPLGEALPEWRIWLELGRRMGFEFPWRSFEEACDFLLAPSKINLEYLKAHPEGYCPRDFLRYEAEGFRTPSGKIEVYSERMAKHGYPPIPTYEEPKESPLASPQLLPHYPLILMAGCRELEYTHSRFRYLKGLSAKRTRPELQINPADAEELGVEEGGWVAVETVRGGVEVRAKVDGEVPMGVVHLPMGWREANINHLTDDATFDPVSGCPGFRASLCKVRAI